MQNCLFFICLFFPFLVTAQINKIDSLKIELGIQKEDTTRLDIMHQLAFWYKRINLDSSHFYYQRSIQEARKISTKMEILHTYWYAERHYVNYETVKADSILKSIFNNRKRSNFFQKHLAWITKLEGFIELRKGNIEKAESILTEAHQLYLNSSQSQANKAQFYDELGEAYSEIGKMETAISWLLKADSAYEKANLPSQVCRVSLNLAIYNMHLERYQEAKKYGLKGLKLAQATNHKTYTAHALSILGPAASELGNQEESLSYALQSLAVWKELGNKLDEAFTHRTIGTIYDQLADYGRAEKYLEKSLTIFRNFNDDQQLIYSLVRYAIILVHNEKIKLARIQLQEAKQLFGKKTSDNVTQMNFYKNLEEIYAQLGDFEQAYHYTHEHQVLRDSIFNAEKLRQIEEVQTKYDVHKKDAQISLQQSELAHKSQRMYAAFALAGLLLISVFLAIRNILQKKRTNAQLRQLDQTKSNFFANISHELRTPLTLIIAPLENALQQSKNTVINDNLKLAHSNGQKLLTLVNEILDLSKLESSKLVLHKKEIHLLTLLRRIFFTFESMAISRNIRLHFDFQLPADLWVKLDIEKFEKILNNLISNAIKFSVTEDSVTLSILPKGDKQILIKVQDTGNGIPPEDLPKIFNRFYQSEQPNQKLQGGTGIGLALAKELSHLFQGELTVSSQVNKGTTFQLLLPLEKVKSKSIEPTTHSDLSEQPATRNSQPATRNSQPATRNSQPATRNSQPATRNPQLATRNPQLATRNPQL